MTAGLRSPHTVTLFDFGVAADGAFYFVMELLDGMDLDRFVRRYGPMPAARATYLLRQLCHSLSEAHAQAFVHRDIEPANVFLCHYGEDHDFVKVLDLGLAHAFDPHRDATDDTRQLAVQGTPAFIAPEQALGRADLDARIDIYGAGCLAYWLLTGQPVFSGDTPLDMLQHHARSAPVAPSTRTELPIPAELEALVLRCLAKEPAARPQSAPELAAALEAIELVEPWTAADARDWWTAHRPSPTGSGG